MYVYPTVSPQTDNPYPQHPVKTTADRTNTVVKTVTKTQILVDNALSLSNLKILVFVIDQRHGFIS